MTASDYAASSQACAAWAGVGATLLAAIASTFVGAVAVLIAYFAPRTARQTKIKASIPYIGHALAVAYAVSASLRNTDPGVDIYIQEILDKIRPATRALDVFFELGVDEPELSKVAINLHASISLFVGYAEFGKTKSPTAKAEFLRRRMDNFDPTFASMLTTLKDLARRYGVDVKEEPFQEPAAA